MFIVQFDVQYVEGTLAGLLIPGNCVTFTERFEAERARDFYQEVELEGGLLRASMTGNSYRVSNIEVHNVH